jgi:hypothetical protein
MHLMASRLRATAAIIEVLKTAIPWKTRELFGIFVFISVAPHHSRWRKTKHLDFTMKGSLFFLKCGYGIFTGPRWNILHDHYS